MKDIFSTPRLITLVTWNLRVPGPVLCVDIVAISSTMTIAESDGRKIKHTKLRLICERHMKTQTPTVDEPSLQTTMPLKTSILLIVFALQP
jgi:hypothetical protein